MRNIIQKFIIFIIFPVLFIQIVVIPKTKFQIKKQKYQKILLDFCEKSDTKVIFLGDSHLKALDQSLLKQDVYNLSGDGDTSKEMLAKLSLALSRQKSIKKVLLLLDYHMFSIGRQKSVMENFLFPFLSKDLLKKLYNNSLWKAKFVNLSPGIDPYFYSFIRNQLKEVFSNMLAGNKKKNKKNSKKRLWKDFSSEKRRKKASGLAKGDYRGIGDSLLQMDMYAKIMTLAEKNGVEVYGIFMPVSPDYLKQLPQKSKKWVRESYKKINIVNMMDCSELFSDNPEYFKDPDHLNLLGAKKLLLKIEQDMQI